jgi:hypothetical protein
LRQRPTAALLEQLRRAAPYLKAAEVYASASPAAKTTMLLFRIPLSLYIGVSIFGLVLTDADFWGGKYAKQ